MDKHIEDLSKPVAWTDNGRLNKLFAGDKDVRILAGAKVTAITTDLERTR